MKINKLKTFAIAALTACVLAGCVKPAPGPVSYTHLDVYKRQGYKLCSRCRSNIF